MDERIALREEYFESMIGKELFNFVCGDYLGEGIQRTVFEYNPDPSCVVKIQANCGFQNVKEWELWRSIQFHDNAKWLAPCVEISSNGLLLIQKKTKEIPDNFKMPKSMPRFLTDTKYENWGIFKGRLVCHDYGLTLCENYAMDKRKKKAEWIDAAPTYVCL